jgi:FkbM family methyltransferase
MRETALHRWVGNRKDHCVLRAIDRATFAVHHILNWAHSDIHSSGEVRMLHALGPHLRTVFDVGAHDGTWAAHLLQAAPQCRVHCFEAAAGTRQTLAARFDRDERVVIPQVGLHSGESSRMLKLYAAASHLSSLADYPHDLEHVWVEVDLVDGDSYGDRVGADRIDFLKIDTEGSEWDVLDGFSRRLGAGSVGAVQFEYGRVNIVARRLLADYAELFERHGYDLFRIRRGSIEPIHYSFDLETFFVANFLAIHRSRHDLLSCVR